MDERAELQAATEASTLAGEPRVQSAGEVLAVLATLGLDLAPFQAAWTASQHPVAQLDLLDLLAHDIDDDGWALDAYWPAAKGYALRPWLASADVELALRAAVDALGA